MIWLMTLREADPSPPFANDATGFAMTIVAVRRTGPYKCETSGGGGLRLTGFGGAEVGEEGRQEADRGKIGADVVDKVDAGVIGEFAERRRADAAQTERQAEKQAGDHANSSGHQLLAIDQDRGKRGGED